jgi:serine/threonine protein kinase
MFPKRFATSRGRAPRQRTELQLHRLGQRAGKAGISPSWPTSYTWTTQITSAEGCRALARALDTAGGTKLTDTGLALGTASYMSPEQGMAQPVDGRTVVYALGCVVFESLVGDPPFTGRTAQAIIARRLTEPVPSIRVVRETVPASAERRRPGSPVAAASVIAVLPVSTAPAADTALDVLGRNIVSTIAADVGQVSARYDGRPAARRSRARGGDAAAARSTPRPFSVSTRSRTMPCAQEIFNQVQLSGAGSLRVYYS